MTIMNPLAIYRSKAPGTLHLSNVSPSTWAHSPSSSTANSLNPTHSFHTFNSCAYKSITQGSQLLPQQSPAGGFTGLVGDEAAASKAFSRMGAGRALSSFVRVGEWALSVDVGKIEGCGIVILVTDVFPLAVTMGRSEMTKFLSVCILQ